MKRVIKFVKGCRPNEFAEMNGIVDSGDFVLHRVVRFVKGTVRIGFVFLRAVDSGKEKIIFNDNFRFVRFAGRRKGDGDTFSAKTAE